MHHVSTHCDVVSFTGRSRQTISRPHPGVELLARQEPELDGDFTQCLALLVRGLGDLAAAS